MQGNKIKSGMLYFISDICTNVFKYKTILFTETSRNIWIVLEKSLLPEHFPQNIWRRNVDHTLTFNSPWNIFWINVNSKRYLQKYHRSRRQLSSSTVTWLQVESHLMWIISDPDWSALNHTLLTGRSMQPMLNNQSILVQSLGRSDKFGIISKTTTIFQKDLKETSFFKVNTQLSVIL